MSGLGETAMALQKCIYTNVLTVGNKQEELEAIMQQEGYDLVAIMENVVGPLL